jgi:hypothetical protein
LDDITVLAELNHIQLEIFVSDTLDSLALYAAARSLSSAEELRASLFLGNFWWISTWRNLPARYAVRQWPRVPGTEFRGSNNTKVGGPPRDHSARTTNVQNVAYSLARTLNIIN